MTLVLHLSGDYPDQQNGGVNSPVIQRLVGVLADQCPQVVVSINRTAKPWLTAMTEESANHLSIRYFAPPFGIGHVFFLHRLATTIEEWLALRGHRPGVIVAHKFTIEGVVAAKLASHLHCDYVLGFMGTTDDKIWSALPWARRRLTHIAANARAWVFPAPAVADRFRQRLSGLANHHCVIPYISHVDEQRSPLRPAADPLAMVTVFHFRSLRHKNLDRLVGGVMKVRAAGLPVTLDIVGTGTNDDIARVDKIIQMHHAETAVRRLGSIAHADIRATLGRYAAMLLPSRRESFGLVYLEALSAGIPILSTRGIGLDGYFPQGFPGVKVDAMSVASIADGIRWLAVHRGKLAPAFANLDNGWHLMTDTAIKRAYLDALGMELTDA